MENIYHIHQSSNSYSDNSWTDTDYILCDSDEEYESLVAEYRQKADAYKNSDSAKKYGEWRISISEEKEVHASEYYYAHEWCGKNFDAVGVCYAERLERSNHYKYILRPNSVRNERKCTSGSMSWIYGS